MSQDGFALQRATTSFILLDATHQTGFGMAKPNYAHQKKQREQAAKKKREEKQQRRQEKKEQPPSPA